MNEIRARQVMKELSDVYNALTYFSDTRHSLWEEQKYFSQFIRPGMRVLDVGCGNGRLLELFPGTPLSYVGIDNSAKLLEKAQQHAKKYPHIRSHFEQSSLLSLPVADNSADVLFCIASLHHIPSRKLQEDALKEFKRVLKPGGVLCMTNWFLSAQPKYVGMQFSQRIFHCSLYKGFGFRDFLIPWHMKNKTLYRFYYAFSFRQLEQLLFNAGFSNISQSIAYGARDWSGKRKKRNIVSIAQA